MNRLLLALGCMAVFAVQSRADVEIGPSDGFAAVKGVANARCEKTKDALVFTDIKYDMQVTCRIRPLETLRVTGFAFRYRVTGETSRPKAGGELFYAPLGAAISGGRMWRIPALIRDGKWHELTVPVSAALNISDWKRCGMMTDFRFDPTNAEGGRLEIAWFRFLTGQSGGKAKAPREKFNGEDVWPKVVPEIVRPVKSDRKERNPVTVTFLGGAATPRTQTAGETVRLRYDCRGDMPDVEFLPVTIAMMEEESGDVVWSEEMQLSMAQCVKRLIGDRWALEFDYELPLYIGSCRVSVWLNTPCMVPATGRTLSARLEVKRIKVDPEWSGKISSKVVEVGGTPYFAVNGKPVYPLWGTTGRGKRGQSARHSSAPLNFVTVWTDHLKWWPKGEEFDPTSLDLLAERHRRDFPGAYFIWDISIYPPPDWRDANPDDMARDEQGCVNLDCGDSEINYSFASKKAYDDMTRIMKKVIDHLESSPYANRIAGYRVNSGHTVEWLAWDPTRKGTILDFSPVAQKGFEAFAKKHYPWVKDFSVPTLAERRELDPDGGVLWNQRKHARVIAYHDFYSHAVADGLIRMCRSAKEFLGGRKLVGTYFGYVMTLNRTGNSHMRAHYATKHLLDAKAVDFLMSPHAYSEESRLPGTQIGDMKPFRSIQNHGIVSVIEDDTRTHNIGPVAYCQTITERMSVNMLRRNMGVSLCRNQPFYTLALTSGCEFDFPQFADDSAVLAKAGAHALSRGVKRSAEVAVVVSEEAIKSTPMYSGMKTVEICVGRTMQRYRHSGEVERYGRLCGYKNAVFPYARFYMEAARIGAGVDYLLAEDLLDNPGDYRLYIFQICTKLTPELVEAAKLLRKRNCTILWTYAPGYTSNDGNSVGNMKLLTGMDFVLCPDVAEPGVTLEDGTKIGSLCYPKDGRPLSPIFAAADPDRVLGRYSNGKPGLAEKRTGKAKTVFSGSYFIEGPLLQRIARDAGVHIFGDSLDIFETNERFVSFHARNAGEKTIRLPRRTTVVDVFNRKLVARDVDSFSFEAELHSSWLFYFADDAEELLKTL